MTQSGAELQWRLASLGLSVISKGIDFRAVEPIEVNGKPLAGQKLHGLDQGKADHVRVDPTIFCTKAPAMPWMA